MTEQHGDMNKHQGEVRTPMECTHCSKHFVALVDYSLNGNHIIECAWCGHEHHRVIRNGKITEERFGSSSGDKRDAHKPRRVWKHNALPISTSSAAHFIRDRWLDKLT